MAHVRAGLTRSIRYAVIGLTTLICLWAVVATARWITLFRDSVALPNGMILKREFDFTRYGRDDLFSTDGKTRLARDVEFICVNDRYVWVYSYERGESGLYDAKANAKRNGLDHSLAFQISELGGNRSACNGYYVGMVGPGLLYDGNTAPFLPSCDWRNFENPTLQRIDWFERPCRSAE